MRLLAAARRSPRARDRVRTIASLAGEGDPKARKALAALAVASKVQKARTAVSKARRLVLPPPTAALVPLRPATAVQHSSGPVAQTPAAPPSADRWWDILAAWRRGIG
jgi:hypothetical protein